MGNQGTTDWVAESAASISSRLEAVKAAQGQTRVALGAMAIISAMMLIASYNAYFSYDYHYITDNVTRKLNSDSIPDALMAQAARDWAASRIIQVSLVGIRVSVDDVAVLGTAVLAVQSFWLVLVTRRENHTIGFLLRDTDASMSALGSGRTTEQTDRQEITDRRWLIFHTIAANALFEAPNTSLLSVDSIHGPGSSLFPPNAFTARASELGFWLIRNFFFFFPLIASLIVFGVDRYSFFLADPFEPEAAIPGTTDEFFWPSALAYAFFMIPLGICCAKADSFSQGTETVLREYFRKLMTDLNAVQPAVPELPTLEANE